MTLQEYIAKTNIRTAEEAQDYLRQINTLLIAVGVLVLVHILGEGYMTESIESGLAVVGWGTYIYLMYVCSQAKKAIKLPVESLVYGFIYGPFGWFILYPSITHPLRIIIGSMPPPDVDPDTLTPEDHKKRERRATWQATKTILIAAVLTITIVITLFVYIMESTPN